MSDWKLDDKEWVKQRKKNGRSISLILAVSSKILMIYLNKIMTILKIIF